MEKVLFLLEMRTKLTKKIQILRLEPQKKYHRGQKKLLSNDFITLYMFLYTTDDTDFTDF